MKDINLCRKIIKLLNKITKFVIKNAGVNDYRGFNV